MNIIGEPDIIPCNFKKAITEPEKVIAPTAAPIDISIKLASLIPPTTPKLKAAVVHRDDVQRWVKDMEEKRADRIKHDTRSF